MTERLKRLAPTRETLRELYLKSGNLCAFSGCRKALFNGKGVFVGQICHIEAAMPGGARFNKKQTNEQRRHVSNLLLMCYDHHVETDNVSKFPVNRMRRIKEEHERKFSDIISSMLLSVTDHTTLTEPIFAKNLKKLDEVLEWDLTEGQLSECVNELEKMSVEFGKIPLPSRELFLVLVNRSQPGRYYADLEISFAEIQQATNLGANDLNECFSILDDYGFTFDNGENDFGGQMVGIPQLKSGWPIWQNIRLFCEREGVDLSQVVINLDFSVLDDED